MRYFVFIWRLESGVRGGKKGGILKFLFLPIEVSKRRWK